MRAPHWGFSMLIAVIADTHLPRGDRRLPTRCVEQLVAADLVVHAGDFSSASALDELEALGTPLVAVHGNVDDAAVCSRLPEELTVDLDGVALGLVHDAGPTQDRIDRLRSRFPDAGAAIFGHSHMPLHEQSDGFQIFNPGSPTERRRAPHHTMGVACVENGRISFEHLVV